MNLCQSFILNTCTCLSLIIYVLWYVNTLLSVIGLVTLISRVSDQNGVSLLYIMLEIHHSGRKPSICFALLTIYLYSHIHSSHVCSFNPHICIYISFIYIYCIYILFIHLSICLSIHLSVLSFSIPISK